MARMCWVRDHSGEVELVRDGVVWARANPRGQWRLYHRSGVGGTASSFEQAKADARAAAEAEVKS